MNRQRHPAGPRRLRRLRRTLSRGAANLLWYSGAPLRAVRAAGARRLRQRRAKAAEGPRSVFASLGAALRGLKYALGSSTVYLWGLLSRGDVRYLAQGLPTVLVGGLLCTIAGASVLSSDVPLESRYKRAAQRALVAENYRAAELYYERLAQLDGGVPETRYALAMTALALNQPDRTRSILLKLAPKDRKGYGPAHLWLARYLVGSANGNREVLLEAHPHVTRALADQANNPFAHAVAARLFAGLRMLDEAETHLVTAISLNAPDEVKANLRLSLARLYVLQNQHALARLEAQEALSYFSRRAGVEPDNHGIRLAWAEAALFLERFDEALSALQAGIVMDLSEQPELRSAYVNRLSQLYTTKATVLGREGKANLAEQLALIDRALQYHPGNLAALNVIIGLSKLSGAVADQAREKLQEALAKGGAQATAHFILGNIAWERGEPDKARWELEIAYELNPRLPEVGNNLAWYIAQSQTPNLSRALEIINSVVSAQPGNPRYRDTRGRIHVKRGAWREALIDLELALPSMQKDPDLHAALATVYRNLGDVEMASQHERLAAQPDSDQ